MHRWAALFGALGIAGALQAASLDIVATTGMVADIARHVAGDRASVVNIMGEGVDPHLYKPVASDVRRIMAADVVLYNGLKLEGRMGDIFERAAARGRFVRPVAAMVDEAYLLEPADEPGHPDPHVWMDVKAWMAATEAVAIALCQADPQGCDTYRHNAESYVAELSRLDAYVRRVVGSIPQGQRVLVTAHDAFNYFGRAYGLEVMGIQGISTESEAGLADVTGLVDTLVERKVPAVFVESSVPDKYVRALIEGAAARGHQVIVGGELFSDAMGKPGTYEGTYVGMIDHNATTVAGALGGEVPQGGFSGPASEAGE
ncbi:MAG: zinc ABC transporter substrate-binding protein [Phycisphaerales bacterium]|jgi:manganese/zinc/iron transport system substrate-binding protein|nr:zinc ABC transporter substrate-binding protein [Phycisphaerales bacterium]